MTCIREVRIPAPPFVAVIRPEWDKPRLKLAPSGAVDKWLCTSSPYGFPIYSHAPDPTRAYQGWVTLAEWQAQARRHVEPKRGWFRWRK